MDKDQIIARMRAKWAMIHHLDRLGISWRDCPERVTVPELPVYKVAPYGSCPEHVCLGYPTSHEGAGDIVVGTWFAVDGSNCVAEGAFYAYQCEKLEGADAGDIYWRAVSAWLAKQHHYTGECKPGECDTKRMCRVRPGLEHLEGVVPGCWEDHLAHGVDPVCVDHG